MFRLDGHDIGDAWYYAADGAVHMYFLTKPDTSAGGWDIGHAATRDLVTWEFLGLALARGAPGSWDDKSLATGSVLSRDGRYWMAFTGHKLDEPLFVQRVGMAVSDDLVRWEKLPENPTSEADPAHYELVSTGQRTLTHWRDPFLLDTGEEVVQYVCARRTDGDISSRGTVGVARSTDMRSWETLPPLEHDPIAEEMEVPQVYAIDGRYYLVFCSHEQWLSPSYKSRFPRTRLSQHGLLDGRRLAVGAVSHPRHGRDHADGRVRVMALRQPARALRGRVVPAEHRQGRRGPYRGLRSGTGRGGRDRHSRRRGAITSNDGAAKARSLSYLPAYPSQ